MAKIFFIPQYPTPNRYQEWWVWKFPEEFRKAGFEVQIVGEKFIKNDYPSRGSLAGFSPIEKAIAFECEQIKEFQTSFIGEDDILFLADISFPGFFSNVLYHHAPSKMFAFCHATSLNKYDYFEMNRESKFSVETGHSLLFDKIFVGSQYHDRKLGWKNTVVTYLPAPNHINCYKYKERIYDIVSASRPTLQKVDDTLESAVVDSFGSITRKATETSDEYYRFLGQSKILLITSHEDTFGYQIVDAINNGCIPLARNSLSYPELLPREYLYNDEEELLRRIDYILNSGDNVPVPKLLCQEQMNKFYENIVKEMKGE